MSNFKLCALFFQARKPKQTHTKTITKHHQRQPQKPAATRQNQKHPTSNCTSQRVKNIVTAKKQVLAQRLLLQDSLTLSQHGETNANNPTCTNFSAVRTQSNAAPRLAQTLRKARNLRHLNCSTRPSASVAIALRNPLWLAGNASTLSTTHVLSDGLANGASSVRVKRS